MEPITTGYALTVFFDMFIMGVGVLAGIVLVNHFDNCMDVNTEFVPTLDIQAKRRY